MCGSIPKGTAIAFQSDADFTIVLHKKPTEHVIEKISRIIISIQDAFPIVSKIDAPICTVNDILDFPYEWGFWIKNISNCIFGHDLGKQIPKLFPCYELQKTYFESAMELIPKNVIEFLNEVDIENKNRAHKKTMKGIIRAIYSLFIISEDALFEDENIFIETIRKYLKTDIKVVNELLFYYSKNEINTNKFNEVIESSIEFYTDRFNQLK